MIFCCKVMQVWKMCLTDECVVFVFNTGYIQAADKLPRTTQKPHTGLSVQGNAVVVSMDMFLRSLPQVWLYSTVQETIVAVFMLIYFDIILFITNKLLNSGLVSVKNTSLNILYINCSLFNTLSTLEATKVNYN